MIARSFESLSVGAFAPPIGRKHPGPVACERFISSKPVICNLSSLDEHRFRDRRAC